MSAVVTRWAVRCEADHIDGGVCARLLPSSGICPGSYEHRDYVIKRVKAKREARDRENRERHEAQGEWP